MKTATEALLELSSDLNYEKMTMQERIIFLSPCVQDILKVNIAKFLISTTIDFKMKRGQGKRAGNMVTGGMGSFYGAQIYAGFSLEKYFKCFSKEDKILICDAGNTGRYLMAREFGLGHKMSIAFSKLYYYGRFGALQQAS